MCAAVSCFFSILLFNAACLTVVVNQAYRGTTLFFLFCERGRGDSYRKWFSLHVPVPAIDNSVEIYYQELDLDKVTHIDTCMRPSSSFLLVSALVLVVQELTPQGRKGR